MTRGKDYAFRFYFISTSILLICVEEHNRYSLKVVNILYIPRLATIYAVLVSEQSLDSATLSATSNGTTSYRFWEGTSGLLDTEFVVKIIKIK